ncbi:MAG: hypothetical protein P0Y60_13860 [Candidatus Microbacterium colombiense]|nr:MAG: hypothetical protein P0Y60_13860 [Microbacterium sp.]
MGVVSSGARATDPLGSAVSRVLAVDPHSGGTAEILGSGGFALAVIALCVLLSRPLRWVLLPLGALGSMPLTAYSAHVLVIMLVSGPAGYVTSNAVLGRHGARIGGRHDPVVDVRRTGAARTAGRSGREGDGGRPCHHRS